MTSPVNSITTIYKLDIGLDVRVTIDICLLSTLSIRHNYPDGNSTGLFITFFYYCYHGNTSGTFRE